MAIIAVPILIALILLYMWKIPYIYQVDMTLTALMINGNHAEEVEIKIQGEYMRYIIPSDIYKGKMIISGFAVTEWLEYTGPFPLGKNTYGFMDYDNYPKLHSRSEWNNRMFGRIMADKKFSSIVIIPDPIYTENPSYTENHTGGSYCWDEINIICYPAKTREEAVIVANEKLSAFYGDAFTPLR